MNFPAANTLLDPTLPEHRDFLAQIQGNILKGHGRTAARLLFFQHPAGQPTPGPAFWGGVRARVTSALQQHRQARVRHKEPNTVLRSFALTACGMHALGVADAAPGPAGTGDALDNTSQHFGGFNAGMRAEFWCEEELRTMPWDADTYGRPGLNLHALWLVASNDPATLACEADRLRTFCAQHGLQFLWEEPLTTWKDQRRNREAFGFADGVSVPAFFQRDAAKHRLAGPWMQIPLSQVLITPQVSSRHAGGSFLVVRKLEQKVKTFRCFEAKLRRLLIEQGLDGSQAGALLIGRYRNGEPLAGWLRRPPKGQRPFNHFNHNNDDDGRRCPFHAHIRKMNPRSDEPATAGGITAASVLATQLVRRGMVYDPKGLLPLHQWADEGTGLMFMAYTHNILASFSVLQGNWPDQDDFPRQAGESGRDPVLTKPGQSWSWRGITVPSLPQFVRPLGGEYFYVPSLAWLANLHPASMATL